LQDARLCHGLVPGGHESAPMCRIDALATPSRAAPMPNVM
jgi:hypothetical protein